MAVGSRDISRRLNPADKLTEDLLIEILSRVPYKSLCRFKCVSKQWRGIISHPDHRKALPQFHLHDLAGFLYSSRDRSVGHFSLLRNFAHVSAGGRPRIRPSLPFLPDCELFNLLDSCNGLLLCRRFETFGSGAFDYVVCNPATEKWVALPGFFSKMQTARLGFDSAVSSHFHVFQFMEDGAADANADTEDDDDDDSDGHVKGVEIYSSKTGVWSHKDNGWGFARIVSDSKSAFVNGFLHLLAVESAVLAVDVEGTTWRVIPMPDDEDALIIDVDYGFIDLSRGRLYLANSDQHDPYKLSIWVLEDYTSEVWVLEHGVKYLNLFGVKNVQLGHEYHIVALHPQQNTIFLVYGHDKVLMSYEMDSGKVQFIHDLGHDSLEPYLPYVPLYSEALADWH
ncbi:F-box protein At5g07610 [Aegilops tauschii subsp. strangulata]|uniref:F-box domain-containing protein n=2 Tax=Aegilops tauschii TaxID=37682 RepID=A0A453QTJ5_AEGTS|nr:F-box protein At5g07610 [Aegilops tauschii subsp. strangulata]